MRIQSVLSLEYIQALIGTSTGNPVDNPVQFAFPASGTRPAPDDWQAAAWVGAGPQPSSYIAECLVGPGGPDGTPALDTGDYDIWIQITGDPEIPAIPAGILRIY